MSESGNIVVDTAARLFADLADPQTVNRAADDSWKKPLWQALADAGLPLAWVPEAHGGADAGLADGFAILKVAGKFALPIPLGETLLAGWLLSRAGIASPDGAMTVAPARPNERVTANPDGTLSGRLRGVPFAREAQHLAVFAGGSVALVEAKACRIVPGHTLAGDASDEVTLDRVRPVRVAPAPNGLDQTALMLMGAAVRSVESAGALEAVLAQTVHYANERVVFDRPIGQNQAIAHPLAMAWAKLEAAEAMCLKAAWLFDHGQPCGAESNTAKLLAAEAGFEACDVALQTHGGYGYAKEFHVERLWREVRLYKIAPVSQQMVLNYLSEHVLGLPKSY